MRNERQRAQAEPGRAHAELQQERHERARGDNARANPHEDRRRQPGLAARR